jgi:hypothetical protein
VLLNVSMDLGSPHLILGGIAIKVQALNLGNMTD